MVWFPAWWSLYKYGSKRFIDIILFTWQRTLNNQVLGQGTTVKGMD